MGYALLALLLASAPQAPQKPESLIQDKLLTPLAARDGSRGSYSRARPPPMERRLRLTDAEPTNDGHGGAFVTFAVDARYGRGEGRWMENTITGCAYAATGEVYVRYGQGFRSADALLGKPSRPAPDHVCRSPGSA